MCTNSHVAFKEQEARTLPAYARRGTAGVFTGMGKEAMIDWQREVLLSFGVRFDNWFCESCSLKRATWAKPGGAGSA